MREQKSDWFLAACAVLGFALAAATTFLWIAARNAAAFDSEHAAKAATALAEARAAETAARAETAAKSATTTGPRQEPDVDVEPLQVPPIPAAAVPSPAERIGS